MSLHDLCSSESSDSVASVIYVNIPTVIANSTTANAAITKRPTASCVGRRQALDATTGHGDRPSIDRDGGGVKRPRQKSPPPKTPSLADGDVDSNGCYDDSSDSSSEEDDDDEGRRMMDVDDDNGCGGRCQLDMDTSSSSSESSQIWNPIGSVRLSLSGRQLKSPPPKTSASYRSSMGAIDQSGPAATTKSRCWSLLVQTDEGESNIIKAQRMQQQQHQGCESDDASVVISNLNVSGFLETDIDEDYRSHTVIDNDHPRRSLIAPADSGFGNETSPELADDDTNQSSRNFPVSASVDQSPCSSVAMRPLPQPSLSFCSPSCSFLRSSMSSIQQQRLPDDDDDGAADCAAIYSTPSTCRASLRRMQSAVPLPSDDVRVGRTSSDDGHSNAKQSQPYKTFSRFDTSTMLSCLYAMFVVVVGTSLSLAEVLMDSMSVATFEGFYSYLFVVGITFLIFIQLSVTRRHSNSSVVCSNRQQCRSDCGSESLGTGVEMGLLNKTANGSPSLPSATTCVNVDKDGGTFFLRLGAIGFAIGAMVSEGLQLTQFVEMQRQTVPSCINANEVLRTFLHIVFIFTQLYFIFMHSETHFHRCPSVCRLGLMHLIATDVCVWLRVIVLETLTIGAASRLLHSSTSSNDDVISGASSSQFVNVTSPAMAIYYHHSTVPLDEIVAAPLFQVERIGFHNEQVVNLSAQQGSLMACKLPDVTSGLISSLSPFLYPCIIQYCWVAIALNGLVWYNVGGRRKPSNGKTSCAQKYTRQFDEPVGSGSGTSSGVFGGLIVLVATVVILVVCLVLSSGSGSNGFRSSTSFSTNAVLTAEAMSDGVRLTVSGIALVATIVVAVCLFHRYDLISGRSSVGVARPLRTGTTLNEILLIISLAGVLAAGIFGAVAGRRIGRPAAIAGCFASAAHAAIQVVVIVTGSRRGAGPTWRLTAIGRQTVAFLTVCNVAAWLIDVAQEGGLRRLGRDGRDGLLQTSYAIDSQLSYQILGLVCVPLAVFHRFQSVVCLSAIWKRG